MTAPSIREALKPCPFCGSDRVSSAHQRDGRVIGCAGCGARVGAFQPGAEEKATEKWNTRTTPAPPQDAVERIARIIKKVAFGGIPTDEPTPICYMTAKIILASGLVTASRPSRKITMSDVRLVAGEGKLSAHDVLAAVNAHLRIHPIGPDEAAIRADERERCAKIADDRWREWRSSYEDDLDGMDTCNDIAAAIRAGGAK